MTDQKIVVHVDQSIFPSLDDSLEFETEDKSKNGSTKVFILTKGTLPERFYVEAVTSEGRIDIVHLPMDELDTIIAKLQKLAQVRDEWATGPAKKK